MKQIELSGEGKNLIDKSFLCFRNLHGVPPSVLKRRQGSWDGKETEVPYFETINTFLPSFCFRWPCHRNCAEAGTGLKNLQEKDNIADTITKGTVSYEPFVIYHCSGQFELK